MFADMADTPYVAVIFSSLRSDVDPAGYDAMAVRMDQLAAEQPGFVGIESARDPDGFGLTVSYWATEGAGRDWKRVAEHLGAQELGRARWYQRYIVRVATVQRQYDWRCDDPDLRLQSPE